MSDIESLTIEANDNCSVVYLIDEELCLSNSYEVINTNFDNVSASQNDLTKYAEKWYGLYTLFSNNSSKWLNALYNVTMLSAQWESAYQTKESYEKYWDVPIYIVYPSILNFTSFYQNSSLYVTQLRDWLNLNFPPSEFILDQKIDLSLNLYTTKSFNYNFYRTKVENCTPATGNSSITICCNGCGRGSAGLCNHYQYDNPKDKNLVSFTCYPVCNDCGVVTDRRCASYTCQTSSPPQTLNLNYNANFSDRYISRIISLVYQNNKNSWILQ